MNSKLKMAGTFAIGAAVGYLITVKVIDSKYAKISQEEINSVKKAYRKKRSKEEKEKEVSAEESEKEHYNKELIKNKYRVEEDISDMTVIKPYVIAPDEFGENDDYERISLTYYLDGILTDENNEPINDVDGLIGESTLTHFGEYEEDSVYVRDDNLHCDYEILLDIRKFSDNKKEG